MHLCRHPFSPLFSATFFSCLAPLSPPALPSSKNNGTYKYWRSYKSRDVLFPRMENKTYVARYVICQIQKKLGSAKTFHLKLKHHTQAFILFFLKKKENKKNLSPLVLLHFGHCIPLLFLPHDHKCMNHFITNTSDLYQTFDIFLHPSYSFSNIHHANNTHHIIKYTSHLHFFCF